MQTTSRSLFETCSDLVGYGEKMRSGDHLAVHLIDRDNAVLLVVADGVGSHACDWLASETACRVICDTFQSSTGPLERRLRDGIVRAHQEIRNATGVASGMLSTVVSVVWPSVENWIFWAGIGDSRIYRFSGKNDLLLTEDHVGRVVLRLNDEVVLSSGAPVFVHGLTKALGQKADFDFEIKKADFYAGESLALATDGMHGNGTFLSSLRSILHRDDLSESVPALVRQCSSSNQDDAALIILRRNDAPDQAVYTSALLSMRDFRQEGLWGHIMSRILIQMLEAGVTEGDNEKVRCCLEYSQRYQVNIRRATLIPVLERALLGDKLDRRIIHMLRSTIGRLS